MFDKFSIDSFEISDDFNIVELGKRCANAIYSNATSNVYFSKNEILTIKNNLLDFNGELLEKHEEIVLFVSGSCMSPDSIRRRDSFIRLHSEGFNSGFLYGMRSLTEKLMSDDITKENFFLFPVNYNSLSNYFTHGTDVWSNRKAIISDKESSLFNTLFPCLLLWLHKFRIYYNIWLNDLEKEYVKNVLREEKARDFVFDIREFRIGQRPFLSIRHAASEELTEFGLRSYEPFWDLRIVSKLLSYPNVVALLYLISQIPTSGCLSDTFKYFISSSWTPERLRESLSILSSIGMVANLPQTSNLVEYLL